MVAYEGMTWRIMAKDNTRARVAGIPKMSFLFSSYSFMHEYVLMGNGLLRPFFSVEAFSVCDVCVSWSCCLHCLSSSAHHFRLGAGSLLQITNLPARLWTSIKLVGYDNMSEPNFTLLTPLFNEQVVSLNLCNSNKNMTTAHCNKRHIGKLRRC